MGVNLFGLKVWLTFSPLHLLLYSQDLNMEQRWSRECPLCAYEGEACRVWGWGRKGEGRNTRKGREKEGPWAGWREGREGTFFRVHPQSQGLKPHLYGLTEQLTEENPKFLPLERFLLVTTYCLNLEQNTCLNIFWN